MKITSLIARYLLGFIFLVFGLNGFLHFIPMPPPASPIAGQFMGALFVSHFLVVVFLLQLIPAIFLLVNRFVPLALILIGPVIVNIFCFHAFMDPKGLPMAIIVSILWILTAFGVKTAFEGLFQQRVVASGSIA
jgi:putative oxidoreductase